MSIFQGRIILRKGTEEEYNNTPTNNYEVGELIFIEDIGKLLIKRSDGQIINIDPSNHYTKNETTKLLQQLENNLASDFNEQFEEFRNEDFITGYYIKEDGTIQLTSNNGDVGNPITVGSGSGGLSFDGGYVDEENKLHLTSEGEDIKGFDPITLPTGGGGGGSTGSRIIFSILSGSNMSVGDGATDANISYNYISTDTLTGEPTGNGTVQVIVNGVLRKTLTVPQGEGVINVAEYLKIGANTIKLILTDNYNTSATRNCTVNKETLTLSWNLSTTFINTGTLALQLTPVGTGDKTVIVEVDGEQYSSDVVTTSGRRFTKSITGLSVGAHLIKAYCVMVINGTELYSNILTCAVAQNSSTNHNPIIAVNCTAENFEQYTTIAIPYIIIDNDNNPTEVTFKVNGNTVDTKSVDQTEQIWAYRPTATGIVTLEIICGSTTWTVTKSVLGIAASVNEVTDDLVLKINPSEMSVLEDWSQGGATLSLSEGFDMINGGLQNDSEGVRCIRITAGDRLTLNYSLFGSDIANRGLEFKIIYKILNSSKKDTQVISCLNGGMGFVAEANNIYLSGNQTTINLSACEDEKTELDVNIQSKSEDRLMSMWESCSTFSYDKYSANENFVHSSAQGVVFGSDDADVLLYLFRAYDRSLTDDELKDNFIFDGSSGTDILNRQNRNDIYTSGKINISEATRLNPKAHFMIINADRMTLGKKDEVSGTIQHIYANGGAEHQWTADMVMKVQGTSSVEHAATAGPNINFELSNITLEDGETILTDGYAMNGVENSIPTKLLTFKKNIASQDHIINKMCQEWYNRYQPVVREARLNDSRVRDCMESVMTVVLFHNTSETAVMVGPDIVEPDETVFFGLGNLCSNKDAVEVFEYDPIVIEVKNNTEPQVLFKSNDLSGDNFDNNFEFRHIDTNMFTEDEAKAEWQKVVEFVNSTDYTSATDEPLKRVETYSGVSFTVDSAAYRKAKWKALAPTIFEMETLYFHHNDTLFFLLRDNRGKNMFWSYDPTTGKWRLIFNWDNDTGLCRNNEGYIDIEPGYLDFDTIGTAYVFNAADNVLFNNLRENNFNELRENYLSRESAGAWDIDRLLAYYDDCQSAVCESLWIEDAQHNAIRVMQNLNTTAYLKRSTGRLRLHIKKALMFQKVLVDSYYNATASTSDSSSFRGYTPANGEWSGVAPNGILEVVTYTDMFVNILAGSISHRVRAYAGIPVQVDLSASLNDTEIYIRNAGWIQELGDMSGMYLGQFEASKLKRVKKLLIGSNVGGYINTNFTTASFDNCVKLEELNMGGLINANKPFDFSNNIYLKKINTRGSGITGITFANGGKLQEAYLNDLSVLELKNLKNVNTLDLISTNNLTTLVVINSLVDIVQICNTAENLSYISFKGVHLHLSNSDLLMRLSKLKGWSDNGSVQNTPIVTGIAELDGMSDYCRGIISSIFPALELRVYSILGSYTVRFMIDENTQYGESQIVEEGGSAVKPAIDPAKTPTVESTFIFAGWQGSVNNITEDTDIICAWVTRTRRYMCKWYDKNGSVLQQENLGYGETVAYKGEDLTSSADKLWTGFDWKSWEYIASTITEDTTDISINASYDDIILPPIRTLDDYDFIYSDDYRDTSAYTLGELAAIVNGHLAQEYGFDINDKIKLLLRPDTTFPDESIIFRIERFHGRRLTGHGEKDTPHEVGDFTDFANITWGMVGTLVNSRAMHSSSTNEGGYAMTTHCAYLNNTLFKEFRPGWRSLIKSVQYNTTAGNSSTRIVTVDCKLHPYTASEVGWSTTEPYNLELDTARYDDGSLIMSYYRNNTKQKRRYNGAGDAMDYWLGSPTAGSASSFCYVLYNGSNSSNYATLSGGVSCCFST